MYRGLIQRRHEALSEEIHCEGWEGPAWAASLLIDCLYRLGVCYLRVGEKDNARHSLERYLALRAMCAGIYQGIYTAEDAETRLQKLATSDPSIIERALKEADEQLVGVS